MARVRFLAALETAVGERLARAPFRWGISDCCLAVCDVVADLGGADAAAGLRGTFGTRTEAEAAIAREGGWREMLARRAAAVGWSEADPGEARPGDVGVVEGGCGLECLAIRLAGRWAVKTRRGEGSRDRAVLAFRPVYPSWEG